MLWQLLNAPSPMNSTFSGIVIDDKLQQLKNANEPMFFKVLGKSISEQLIQL
mgnify:CR=1 FL=1